MLLTNSRTLLTCHTVCDPRCWYKEALLHAKAKAAWMHALLTAYLGTKPEGHSPPHTTRDGWCWDQVD
jgi:hypothetical protein